jgi:hypothetical protein
VQLTFVFEDVQTTLLVDLESWWEVLKAAHARTAFTLDEEAVTRTERLVHHR